MTKYWTALFTTLLSLIGVAELGLLLRRRSRANTDSATTPTTSPHTSRKDRTRNFFAHNTLAVLGALALIVLPSAASAVPLAPGNFVNLSGATAAARPELAGVVLQDVIRPFSVDLGGGNFTTGTIQDRVVRETGSGTLDFYYRISNDVSSAGSVDYVTRNSFAGFGTDVDFRTDGLGTIGPNQASRNAAGDEVVFDFFSTHLLFPGAESLFFVCVTVRGAEYVGVWICRECGEHGASALKSSTADQASTRAQIDLCNHHNFVHRLARKPK